MMKTICRRFSIYLALIIVFVLISLGSFSSYCAEMSQSLQKQLSADGVKYVSIRNARGEVTVSGSERSHEIICRYVLSAKGPEGEKLERAFSELKVSLERRGDTVAIEVSYTEESDAISFFPFLWKSRIRARVDLDISLPASLRLSIATARADISIVSMGESIEISTASGDAILRDLGSTLKFQSASGDLVAQNISGSVDITTSSGDVKLGKVSGHVAVRSASGDVLASDIRGDVVVHTSSGDVSIKNAGSVECRTVSGDAFFTGIAGGFQASSSSGDVSFVALPDAAADYKVASSSGDVKVRFEKPVPGGFRFVAKTSSGEIRVKLPMEVTEVSRNVLSGIVGEGKSSFSVETSSGDIVVDYYER